MRDAAFRRGLVAVVAASAMTIAATGPCRAAGGRAVPTAAKSTAAARVTVSYADLVDGAVVTRSGRRLGDAVTDPKTPRAQLQPFLDSYSSLLPYVVGMARGTEEAGWRDVTERWPAGGGQPAWVALFREGRYRAVSDGGARVRLFLPGDTASAAWRTHYPVVRHCLSALAERAGGPLTVEVFAYRNDYRRMELRLDLSPAAVTGATFPPDRPPLDLAALEEFFGLEGHLEGVRFDGREGLVLFARPGRRDTLSGEPVSLSDFAATYRAVFHAGDNDAFISLDPNADPTLASVNFGGHLEDTRIGAVVLAADRRFKTISSGLDPVTSRDVRSEIRGTVPGFLTNAERSFLDRNAPRPAGWQGTRFWFYPDSIGVEADPVEGLALVTRPRFTADAERIGEGFETIGSKGRRAALGPGVRENIRDLNENFDRYAKAFPEFGELAGVARLMAVAVWLKRQDTASIDMDALLSVALPAVATPRVLERIVSAEYVVMPASVPVTPEEIGNRSGVMLLTPVLGKSVGEVFPTAGDLAEFLSATGELPKPPPPDAPIRAAAVLESRRGDPVRSLLRSEADLQAFLLYLGSRTRYPASREQEGVRRQAAADMERIRRMRREAEATGAEPGGVQGGIEREKAEILKRYHDATGPGSDRYARSELLVSGGISLRPREFTLREGTGSAALREFSRLAGAAPVGGVAAGGAGATGLLRSRSAGKPAVRSAGAPSTVPPKPSTATKRPTPAVVSGTKAGPPAPAPRVGAPAAVLPAGGPVAIGERIVVPAGALASGPAVGEMAADGRIVFRKGVGR